METSKPFAPLLSLSARFLIPAMQVGRKMLIIEWLLVLPHNSGTTVVKKTVTNFDTAIDAVSRAHEMWPFVRTKQRRVGGFQIVDQDGRIIAAACLDRIDGLAA